MEIIEIKPQGFCFGVKNAIELINKALDNDKLDRPIYMLGDLVHNKHVVSELKKKGVIVLNSNSRENLLKNISTGTIILTAHGVGDNIYKMLKEKKLNYIDSTCPNVLKTNKLIKEKLADGYKIIYLGVNGHPETEGVISNSSDIFLVTIQDNINNLNINHPKLFFTNQTTISTFDVLQLYEKLKQKFPDLEYSEEVCSATKLRQKAVIKYGQNLDLVIVVGDKKSNNSRELHKVCLIHTNAKCELIESVVDLNLIDFTNIKKVGITSGASTPDYLVKEIIDALKNISLQKWYVFYFSWP